MAHAQNEDEVTGDCGLPSMRQQVLREIRARARQFKEEKLAEQRAREVVRLQCARQMAEMESGLIGSCRALRDVGKWARVPHHCETHCLTLDVRDACEQVGGEEPNISALASLWRERHRGIERAPKQKVKSSKESRCCIVGTCLCRRSTTGLETAAFLAAATRALKAMIRNKDEQHSLMAGFVGFLWWAGDSSETLVIRLYHVSSMYKCTCSRRGRRCRHS